MATPLRVVILEDDPREAARLVSELERAKYAPIWLRVATQAEYLANLDPAPDLILTNYTLQQFDGFTALELMRERGMDVPFIIVADSVSADLAVAAVKAGADDYLATHRIPQLGGVVARALSQRRLRVVQRRTDLAYRFLHEAGRTLTSSLDYPTAIKALAALVVPTIADHCVVALQGDDGVVRWLTTGSGPARRNETEPDWASDHTAEPIVSPDLVRVVRSGVPELERLQLEEEPGGAAADAREAPFAEVRIPLIARGRVIGAISFSTRDSTRRFDFVDLGLLEEIGRLAALAIDNGRLHQEVHAALATRDRFLAIAAHELRTPVTEIRGFAQLLVSANARNASDPALATRYISRIMEGSNRLTRLSHDLLDAGYLDEGELPFRMTLVDLSALAHDAAERQRDQLGATRHILVDAPLDPCLIEADRDRVDQVLTNLLSNAVKFSPEGSDIHLIVTPSRSGVRMTVQDSGIGLPAGETATIFTPFTRASNARDHAVPGLGLGLSVSRTIMKRHGGQIWAESRGQGLGAEVSAWFPMANAAMSGTPSPHKETDRLLQPSELLQASAPAPRARPRSRPRPLIDRPGDGQSPIGLPGADRIVAR